MSPHNSTLCLIPFIPSASPFLYRIASLRFILFLKQPSLRLRAWRDRRQRRLCSITCGCTALLCWASWHWWCLWGSDMSISWRWSSWPVSFFLLWLSMLESSRLPLTRLCFRKWLFIHLYKSPVRSNFGPWHVCLVSAVFAASVCWEIELFFLKDMTSVQRSLR